MIKKKIKIRRRILATFRLVLLFSYAVTGVIFSIAFDLFPLRGNEESSAFSYIWTRNHIFLIILAMMFLITWIATYILANSITNPIEKLGKFALGIGKGDFTPNDFTFREEELEALNHALNDSVRQLAIYDNDQKTFFQNVSHELRTPLMSIQCYAEGISFGIMDGKEASATILRETDKLSELVQDLLYIAKIDNITTVYQRTKIDFIQMIIECVNRQQVVAEQRNIQFSFDFPKEKLFFMGIEELLSRAIDNLISNGIRYAHSNITLTCRKKGEYVILSVRDDGDGIEAAVLPRIFERFNKGKKGNTGIGLSIVKSIVLQHHGDVKGENLEDGGAVFTITLREV